MLRRQMQLDFSGIKTYSAEDRHNLVTIDNMMTPAEQSDAQNNEEADGNEKESE